jgi:hypothetical protein
MGKKRRAKLQVRRDFPYNPDEPVSTQWPAILEQKFKRWRRLKVWETDLNDVRLILGKRVGHPSTGLACTDAPCRIIINAGYNKADGFSTLLHECAHIDCMQQNGDNTHGTFWQETFLKAAESIIGRKIKPEKMSMWGVHEAIASAFAKYLVDNSFPKKS